jgi:hypothetical protein
VGYILKHEHEPVKSWQVYGGETLTLKPGDFLRVIAQRIGYQPNNEVTP